MVHYRVFPYVGREQAVARQMATLAQRRHRLKRLEATVFARRRHPAHE